MTVDELKRHIDEKCAIQHRSTSLEMKEMKEKIKQLDLRTWTILVAIIVNVGVVLLK